MDRYIDMWYDDCLDEWPDDEDTRRTSNSMFWRADDKLNYWEKEEKYGRHFYSNCGQR